MKNSFWSAIAALTLCTSSQAEKPAHDRRHALESALAVPTAAVATNALSAYFRITEDFHAGFTQTLYSHRGEEQSSGEVWLARPGKFYWDYRRPDRQQIIGDGRTVYHYDLDLEQISVYRRDELVGDVAIQVLSGQRALNDAFTVTEPPRSTIPQMLQNYGEDGRIYRLTPKNTQDSYDAVWIVIRTGTLGAIMIDGGGDQKTVIVFHNPERNIGIPASRFAFTPPPGVDVVGNPGS